MARDGALVISTASASHSGDFKCVATNEAGSVERKTRLKVNGEDSFNPVFFRLTNYLELKHKSSLILLHLFSSPRDPR